jgi:hypothetical protein
MGIYNRYANIKIVRPDEDIFPKWIDANGISILVHDKQEELEALQIRPVENPSGFGESLGNPKEYKLKLFNEAIELGIPAKRTWGPEKLRKAIHDYSRRLN